MLNELCPICQNSMNSKYEVWHLQCQKCNYENASLEPTINLLSSTLKVNEQEREKGLQDLRINNFNTLLTAIKTLKSNGGRLLEVGCAHGWFLNIAKNDFSVIGIEPDKNVYKLASQFRLNIRNGYFPESLENNERFDVIVFNDVFEHIPNIKNIIKSCYQHLNEEGILVLNLPSSDGVFYKISKIFNQCGISKFFERMWQKDLPSPHLHYFNMENISIFLKNNDFKVEAKGTLPTLTLKGLLKRISNVGHLNIINRFLIYVGIVILFPIINIMPKDIIYVIAKKK